MIEPATEEDIPALNALINSAYRGDSSRKGWTTEADLLDGLRTDEQMLIDIIRDCESTILKYSMEERIVACVHLKKENEKLYLGMLTVSPELQGKGIGNEFLLAAEEVAEKKNCATIFMTVISLRKELIEWYFRHGYVDTGERKPFHHNDIRFGIPKMPLEFTVLEKTLERIS